MSSELITSFTLNEIDDTDRRFAITFPSNCDKMIRSLQRYGQLYPIFVRMENKKAIVIDGFQRFQAAKQLKFDFIEAKVFSSETYTPLDCYILHMQTIISIRSFNEVEKAGIVTTLTDKYNLSSNELQNDFELLADTPLSANYIDLCSKVSTLPDDIKRYIVKKNVTLQFLKKYCKMDFISFLSIIEIARKLQLGANKLRNLMSMMHEIAFREKCTPFQILKTPELSKIINNSSMTNSQIWDHLSQLIYNLRYTEWPKVEKELINDITSLNLPKGIKISYPKYLEGEFLSLNINFRNQDELLQQGEFLTNLSKLDSMKNIIKKIK